MAEAALKAPTKKFTGTLLYICVVGIFVLGTGLSFLDLTDPPLDYFPQRQERGAIIARSIYYQLLPSADPSVRNQAVYLAKTMDLNEPAIFEAIVAVTYLATGGEHLWIARIYAIIFWLLGGVALFLLARRLTSTLAAIASLIFYFFLPWSVIFARIFQPDVPMMTLTLWAAYTLYRWGETPAWKWAIATGILGGLAAVVKLPAIFPAAVMLIGVTLTTLGIKKTLKNIQVWFMAALIIGPPVIFYVFFIPSFSAPYFEYTVSLLRNLIQPSFYIRWIIFAGGLVDLGVAIISFLSLWLLPKKARIIPIALWIGYLLYGMAFPHHIITHEYYSIPLIPAIALSLAPLASLVFNRIKEYDRLAIWAIVGVLIFSIFYSGWMARSILLGKSYRNEAIGWQEMRQALPKDGAMMGITHEEGYRIAYYGWRHVTPWPYNPESEASLGTENPSEQFSNLFKEATGGQDYFIVTLFSRFNAQPLLKAYLYDHYPIYAQGSGYLIFDLTKPGSPSP